MARNVRTKQTLAQEAAEATAASALTTHAAAADPHTGYLKESDANYIDLTDGGDTALHTHAGGGNPIDAWPIGSVFISVVATSPATLLGGGTWSAIGAGRVLVGLDSGDANFDTVEETGGAKTVTSTGTVAAPVFTGNALGTHLHAAGTYVPSAHAGATVNNHTDVLNHLHTLATGTTATGNFSQVIGTVDTSSGGTGGTPTQTALGTLSGNPTANGTAAQVHTVGQASAHTMSGSSEAVSAGTPAGTNSAPTFTGNATSVVQPYFVVYMWKRTA